MKQAMPVPSFKKSHRAAWSSSTEMVEDHFDADYCKNAASRIEALILKSYRALVMPEESKKKILGLRASSILYASLHKSHFDYVAVCGKMFLEGLPCPRTIAGSNLLTGWIGWSIKYLTGIDMIKWGAIPVERQPSIPRNLLAFCSRIEALLKINKPILVFPEIETSTNGHGKSIRTGRAYSGKIRKFASAPFSPAINASKEGKKVYIVPVAVSYDFVAEDRYFCSLTKAVAMKEFKNVFISILGKFYYLFLEFHFFYRMYRLGYGNIYIDTGRPILVEPNASEKELAHLAQQEAARCYRVTMPALVSYAMHKGATSGDQLQKSVERYSEILKAANINFQPSTNLKEGIEGALDGLVRRKIISNHGAISVKKPDIITYYANTIAHHFERI
jgi:hypothetical protein